MKSLLTRIGTLALYFLGSGFVFAEPSKVVSSLIAETLPEDVSMLLKGLEYKHNGTAINVGDKQLEVIPYIENQGVQEDEYLFGIRLEINVNGKKDKRLTYGTVGNGKTIDAAQRSAVYEWWVAFAKPLIWSLAHKNTDFSQSPYTAFFGSTIIRGTPPGGWINTKEMHQKITTSLFAEIGEEPSVKAIALMVLVSPSGEVGGECRVNGQVSQEILEGLRKLDWPIAEENYIFKQVYILKHKSEA